MRCRGGGSQSRRRTGVISGPSIKRGWPPDLSLRGGRRPTWRPEREARGRALGVQSRSSRLHRGKVTGEIATAFPRLPRRFAPRNDTSGGYCGAPAPSSGLIPLCKALNERRYRRNRSVRFYRHLVRTGSAFPRLPRRFAPRNDTSGQRSNGNGTAHRIGGTTAASRTGLAVPAPTGPVRIERRLVQIGNAFPRLPRPLWGLAMTNLEALHIRRECLHICNCPWRSLSAATDAIGAYHFNGGLCESPVPSRDCHGRKAPSQ